MFTLAHLSDPHLAPLPQPRLAELVGKRITGYANWWRHRRLIHDRAVLDKLVADLETRDADHIALTGDIANIAAEAEFACGRAFLERLGGPHEVSFVPGNHDIYAAAGARYAAREWGAYMRGDDGGAEFPYVRRRGPLALIGLSTGVPTLPLMATGTLGPRQIAALTPLLARLRDEGLFRVVLIHHPPVSETGWHKRLTDAAPLLRALAAEGAELLLHGHDHRPMLNWLQGPAGTRVPAVGVPSASASPAHAKRPAGYNVYTIDGAAGAWHCEMVSRGVGADGAIGETARAKLS